MFASEFARVLLYGQLGPLGVPYGTCCRHTLASLATERLALPSLRRHHCINSTWRLLASVPWLFRVCLKPPSLVSRSGTKIILPP